MSLTGHSLGALGSPRGSWLTFELLRELVNIWKSDLILPFYAHLLFFKDFIYFVLEKREGREKERQRNIDVREIHGAVASHRPAAGDLAHNPSTCPDWESNQQLFGLQAGVQSTEPHQPGLHIYFVSF